MLKLKTTYDTIKPVKVEVNFVDEIKNRLKAALSARGISQIELCQATGIPKSSISQYLSGYAKPKQDRIYLMSQTLDVSEAWLMGYDVPMERNTASAEMDNTLHLPSNIIPVPPASKTVPLLGTIACGVPILAEENLDGEVSLPDFIHADFALRCKGDSMVDARILDGDIVYIRKQPDVENGEIAAVLIDDEATLKRVYKYPGQIVLQPANSKYAPMIYTGESINEMRILGKAVFFLSTVQ